MKCTSKTLATYGVVTMADAIKPEQMNHVPFYLRWLGKFLLRLWGWKIIGNYHEHPKGVFISQHTSNWDGILALTAAYSEGVRPRWIGKPSLFAGGRRGFMKMTGGIEINRQYLGSFVEDVLEAIEGDDIVWIYISPEGTRKKVKYWKEGFYLIAEKANIPIVHGYFNYKTKELGFRESLIPSGDIYADMAIIRGWFEDAQPKYPENTGEVCIKVRASKQSNGEVR
jgi:1-acyl-sn-glycerol-3-phosphate acyltransferase